MKSRSQGTEISSLALMRIKVSAKGHDEPEPKKKEELPLASDGAGEVARQH